MSLPYMAIRYPWVGGWGSRVGLAPALPRGCGAALEVSLNGQQYEPLGTGGVAYTAVSDCGRGAHAAALVPPRALT